MRMNLEKIQAYFKRQIEKGNYEVKEVNTAHVNTWISLLVDNRPFVIKINEIETKQDGDISENYIQLGKFNKDQHIKIYEREKKRGLIRNY